MINKDLLTLLNANSMIIEGDGKAGKMTFLFYLINFFYKDKAIVFTPQEAYLFNRRVNALSSQYPQFKNLKESFTPYFLDEDWNSLKQKYGYEFFLKELEHIIVTSEESIIVIHRISEFFEFQDRYEIEGVYKTLIKTATMHNKKMIFLVNNRHENFEYIHRIAEEFTDISITIKNNEKNERLLNIKDVLQHKEYPLMDFKIHKENFILDIYKKDEKDIDNITKNILIAELNETDGHIKDICTYIFNKPHFNIKFANSIQTILQEVFISPDVIIVFIKRDQKNFDTIAAIKKQLPETMIIGILDQEFVRTEDIQEAYANGCDELFANNLSLDQLILSLQKAAKNLFYSKDIQALSSKENIIKSIDEFKSFISECVDKSLFFTVFTLESKHVFDPITASSRNSDFIYHTDYKIYYLALSTMPKDITKIVENYRKTHNDLELTCMWEPTTSKSIDECLV